MKISYRTHPILKTLPKDYKETGNKNIDDFAGILYRASKNVNILSKSFTKAIELSWDKMQDTEMIKTIKAGSGCIVDEVFTYIYEVNDGIGNMMLLLFKGEQLILTFATHNGEGQGNTPIDLKGSPFKTTEDFIAWGVHTLKTILLFIKYAEIETKELPANKKVKGIDCKYVNETNINIRYLDMTWFTNIIKSEGFGVRGHFRFQPKKINGQWTKELIWIKDFEKHGYTAPARKLKEIFG